MIPVMRSAAMIGLLLVLLAATAGCWSRSGGMANTRLFQDPDPDFELPQIGDGLEFRIVANEMDDAEAIAESAASLHGADLTPAQRAELADLQAKGLPPPGPRRPGDGAPREFIPRNRKSRHAYAWVELGPQMRITIDLANDILFMTRHPGVVDRRPNQGPFWQEMEAARIQGRATTLLDHNQRKLLQGALFYSRECKNQNLTEEQRQKKKIDYFVLTRLAEIDADGALVAWGTSRAVTGKYLTRVFSAPGFDGRPTLHFNFNGTGETLMHHLTASNLHDDHERRVLAMIFHGMVVSAPSINSRIGREGQISGNFMPRELDKIVAVLHEGMQPR
jgi:hypothetical protein